MFWSDWVLAFAGVHRAGGAGDLYRSLTTQTSRPAHPRAAQAAPGLPTAPITSLPPQFLRQPSRAVRYPRNDPRDWRSSSVVAQKEERSRRLM